MKRIIGQTTKLIGNTSFRVERYLDKEEGKTVVRQGVKVKNVAPNPFKREDHGEET